MMQKFWTSFTVSVVRWNMFCMETKIQYLNSIDHVSKSVQVV